MFNYYPPRRVITFNQFNNFFITPGQKFIIGGDLNAKNTLGMPNEQSSW